jgi:hypothetical protein
MTEYTPMSARLANPFRHKTGVRSPEGSAEAFNQDFDHDGALDETNVNGTSTVMGADTAAATDLFSREQLAIARSGFEGGDALPRWLIGDVAKGESSGASAATNHNPAISLADVSLGMKPSEEIAARAVVNVMKSDEPTAAIGSSEHHTIREYDDRWDIDYAD